MDWSIKKSLWIFCIAFVVMTITMGIGSALLLVGGMIVLSLLLS